jgi:glycosyltransferase involved in cell wall biosynthesis
VQSRDSVVIGKATTQIQRAQTLYRETRTSARPDKVPSILKDQRVIFVLGNLELGGAERQALILARHLAEVEHAKVEVWGFNKSGPVADLCELHGIGWKVIPYPFRAYPPSRLASLLTVARELRKARPDVLLPYTLVPNVVCGLLWKWTGARLCVWNQRDEGIVPLTARWERWAVKRTPRFISNSSAGARYLVNDLNVSAEKVRVVQNGIEEGKPQLDRKAWREQLEIDEASFVACMVANLHLNKDHQTLLREWSTVMVAMQKKKRSAVLVLAGRHDGAYESLVALTHEVGIVSSVRFVGPVSDVSGLLSAVDLGVFSSFSEGCPNAVLEYMAAGLAVAATDIEGVREVVGPKGAPFLASAENPGALARIILQLADDPELRCRVGAENQQRIRERFAARRMCEETVSLLVDSGAKVRE